jgi:hypothetical protein
LKGHQASRMFVSNCRASGDRLLAAIILEMVGFTAPRQHYPYLARWPGRETSLASSQTGAHGASVVRF